MSFTGKATHSDRTEDLSDLVAILSPYETPLLDALGDSLREALSTHHEWLENDIRQSNHTQIFSKKVEVKMKWGRTNLADKMDYLKQEKLRELLRTLEKAVITGEMWKDFLNPINDWCLDKFDVSLPPADGDSPCAMRGIIQHLSTNVFQVHDGKLPGGDSLDKGKLDYAIKQIRDSHNVDLIVVGGYQKRLFNKFCKNSFYDNDLAICRVITTRWMPQDAVLFLDSSRVNVLPLAGRSFHFKPLASTDDYGRGEVIGEYTLELKNEAAHGIIRGLAEYS